MKKDLVSCIVPTYKRSDTLPRAINSVLRQSYTPIEVLVVDDNPPDSAESNDVKRILNQYTNYPNVIYVGQKKHINGAVARNVGIQAADGEFIAFLDDDEEWLPEKTKIQVDYLRDHPEIAGVSCLYSDYRNGREISRISEYDGTDLQLKILTGRIMVHTSTFLCRREIIEKSNGFAPNLLRHQDLQMLVDFLNYGRIEPICKRMVLNHIDSEINRPNAYRLITVKNDFLDAVKNSIEKYDRKTQRRIYSTHNYEIAYIALKQKDIILAIKYIIKAGISLGAVYDLMERYRFKKRI